MELGSYANGSIKFTSYFCVHDESYSSGIECSCQAAKNILHCGSATIDDNFCLWVASVATMLFYFQVCLKVLRHYCACLKLMKSQFLTQSSEFDGIMLGSDRNSLTLSNYEAFRKMKRSEMWINLSVLIGMFVFYKKWLYEVHIQPWQTIQKEWPNPGMCIIQEEQELMSTHWKESDFKMLEEIKSNVLSVPVLT